MNAKLDKRKLGLFNKFNVTRTDGTDAPGGKHHGCEYFVLDITHDPFAVAALRAYADACGKEYPVLASDLRRKIAQPCAQAAAYFAQKGIKKIICISKVDFDWHAKQDFFADGPYRESFGDGMGDPYSPHRQAWGVNAVGGEGLFTELSEGGAA